MEARVAAAYPQRQPQTPKPLEKAVRTARRFTGRRMRPGGRSFQEFLGVVRTESPPLRDLDDSALRSLAADVGGRLRREGFRPRLVARCFALVAESARRTIGMTPYDVQFFGGLSILRGHVAEMATGEGKTLTATLPACAAALAGIPVHVVTVNDYLTARDSEWMGSVYKNLGLTVGTIVHECSMDQRRAAYACDVAYTTNKELVFDFLRDRLALGARSRRPQLVAESIYAPSPRLKQLLLRGLQFAIVDEADSIFIDEARTPVILSAAPQQIVEAQLYLQAATLADGLAEGPDFQVDRKARQVEITDGGRERLEVRCEGMGPFWAGPRRREEMVQDALSARHLFERDKHYLVSDGRIVMIDEYTGRAMPDRHWSLGLHQAIEAKEGCPITGPPETLAQISYQQFFRHYLRLAGMTGTAREVAGELWAVYGLRVVAVPTHRPLARRQLRHRFFAAAEAKWRAVVDHVAQVHAEGRPVLIGTRSVESSERLSSLLREAGLEHRVLNARQNKREAQIVARAGGPGRITVATNMAGRGTDIRLGEGVAQKGGLHVVATERHEAGRIDRQLFGRCARQGDPGSCILFLSLEDELVKRFCPRLLRALRPLGGAGSRLQDWLERMVGGASQTAAEWTHRRMRKRVMQMDEQLRSALSFAGRSE